MKRRILIGGVLVTLVLSVVVTPLTLAANITYSVGAVAMSGGYFVQGGYITTNGTVGLLSVTDIVDYHFEVNGLYPFVFSSSSGFSPGLQLGGQLVATPDSVYLPWSTLPQPLNTFVLIDAVGGQNFSLYYQNGIFDPFESVSRISYFLLPSSPTVSAMANFPQGNSLFVASIPEPASASLMILIALTQGVARKRFRIP